MQQPLKQKDSMVQVETSTLPNGKQISFLMTAKGPSCFRRQPDSLWEPIGDDNMALTIAVNRFLKVRYQAISQS
jgi:hypothetical protein